jgi:signal transduction histidine kinase
MPRARAIDLSLVAAVAAAMTLTIAVAEEEGAERAPDALAFALGLGVAAILLLRRRRPLVALVGTLALLMTYYSLDYPAFSPAVPLAAVAYSAAVAGRLPGATALLAVFVALATGYQSAVEGESLASVLGTRVLADAALLAAVLLLGEAVRHRRAWAGEVQARLARAEADREQDALRRVQEERLRIARELHDVMAHTIAGIGVQAGVAADVLRHAPDEAEAALRAIRAQSREAMAEVRAAVGVLRAGDGGAPRAPAPRLDDLGELARTTRATGVSVDVRVAGDARTLPHAVDLTAYRIVQESLTNVVRHAGASAARVVVRYDADAVALEVGDDGRGAPDGAAVAGHGIAGMRERAAALGGTLEAGAAPDGGFRVRARLPAPRVPA